MEEVSMPKATFDTLTQQISMLQDTVDHLTEQFREKNQIILNQNWARLGQSSERRTCLLCDGQGSMFNQVGYRITEKAPEAAAEEKKMVAVVPHSRRTKRNIEKFAVHVPEEAVILGLPDAENYTQEHRPLKYIGMDLIRTGLVREPARVYVKKYYVRT